MKNKRMRTLLKQGASQHTMKRLAERYDEKPMDIVLYNALRRILLQGKGEVLFRFSNTRAVYRCFYEGRYFYPIYSKTRKEILTVLPANDERLKAYQKGEGNEDHE